MSKKIFYIGALFVLTLLFVMFNPSNVLAAGTEVTSIEVTMPEPVIGQTIPTQTSDFEVKVNGTAVTVEKGYVSR